MSSLKLYSELAEYYYHIEKASRNFKQEIECLDILFQTYRAKTILDLGCGTGEHVEALRRMGYEILGIDNSSYMLDVAKKRFPYAKFQLADMQNFQLNSNYDALICLFGTFNYLVTGEDIENTLNSISRCLKPKGILVLEVWNSIPLQKIQKKPIAPVNVCTIGQTILKRNRGFKVFQSDGKENLVEVNFLFDLNSKIIRDHHVMRVFTRLEIENYLNQFHFEIQGVYKDYQRRKFQDKSVRMLFVCQKRR